jgi:DNA modification methylase
MAQPKIQIDNTKFGKAYRGEDRLLVCGDYAKVLVDMPPCDLIVTSPPYNIGSVSERKDGRRKHGQYDAKSFGGPRDYFDRMPEAEYQQWQHDTLEWCGQQILPNGVIVYNHKPRHRKGELILPTSWFPSSLRLYDMIVWNRGSTHNHSPSYVYQHTERLYILAKVGGSPYFKNESWGDDWRINREAHRGGKIHSAPFPLELVQRCIRLWCPPGGVVCDPFSGSGTTMIAARVEGRRFYGAEIMYEHFENSEERYQKYFGDGR